MTCDCLESLQQHKGSGFGWNINSVAEILSISSFVPLKGGIDNNLKKAIS